MVPCGNWWIRWTHTAADMQIHDSDTTHPLVLAITGASGAVYATRLLEMLLAAGREVSGDQSVGARR
jgi:hypothetical protein